MLHWPLVVSLLCHISFLFSNYFIFPTLPEDPTPSLQCKQSIINSHTLVFFSLNGIFAWNIVPCEIILCVAGPPSEMCCKFIAKLRFYRFMYLFCSVCIVCSTLFVFVCDVYVGGAPIGFCLLRSPYPL